MLDVRRQRLAGRIPGKILDFWVAGGLLEAYKALTRLLVTRLGLDLDLLQLEPMEWTQEGQLTVWKTGFTRGVKMQMLGASALIFDQKMKQKTWAHNCEVMTVKRGL